MDMNDYTHRKDLKHLWSLIQDIRFGMLAHRHADGGLHAHPLTTQNKSLDDGMLYFFVNKSTEVGRRLQLDGDVCVAYSDPQKDHYVSVTGHATLNEDRAKKESLFNAMTKAWFPGGVDDPNLELVQVRITHAEYWDVKESKITQLVKMGRAAITGHQPQMGEHKEVHFS